MATRIHHDIISMSSAELESTYGIEIDEDGTVWDDLEGMEFHSLSEWADFCDSQDEDQGSFIKVGGKMQLIN